MSANDRTSVGAGTVEWGTPPELFAHLNERYRFNYDAFASHANALCELYSTVDGTFSRYLAGPAELRKLDEATGLEYDWTGLRVFCNPPYARGLIERCIDKIIAERERAAIIVVLVNAATETAWFRALRTASFVEYPAQRVAYIHPPFACKDGCTHALGQAVKGSPSGAAICLLREGAL